MKKITNVTELLNVYSIEDLEFAIRALNDKDVAEHIFNNIDNADIEVSTFNKKISYILLDTNLQNLTFNAIKKVSSS